MTKLFLGMMLFSSLLLIGCSGSIKYNDEDVAAIVKGKEITIGELRFLYPDDKVLDMIDGTIKAELVVHEAKKMNIDVTDEIQNVYESWGEYPYEYLDEQFAKSLRNFLEPQSKKLGMEPGEYHKKYIELTTETNAYVNAYIQEILGEPTDNIDEYNEKANRVLNELVEANKDEIQILIN